MGQGEERESMASIAGALPAPRWHRTALPSHTCRVIRHGRLQDQDALCVRKTGIDRASGWGWGLFCFVSRAAIGEIPQQVP